MKTVTLEQATANFQAIIDYSLQTHDEVNIASDKGAVMIIPQEDYEAIQESLRLLSDKQSLKALLDGHNIRKNGGIPKSYALEDVFSDLQN